MPGTMSKSAKRCVRPWTLQERSRRRRHPTPQVVVPLVDTYQHHMKRVQELHQRLKLDSPRTTTTSNNAISHMQEAPFRLIHRSATVVTFSAANHVGNKAPATFPSPSRSGRSLGLSHPLLGAKAKDAWRHSTDTEPAQSFVASFSPPNDLDSSSSSSTPEDVNGSSRSPEQTNRDGEDRDRQKKRHRQVDILKLCEHLKAQGLGEPVMFTSSHFHYRDKLPPGLTSRTLPRDPSTREKIKGRARLDYELANLRAAAFCEQQQAQAFRTASANLRNRDVRFVEEEEREQVHKDLQEDDGDSPSVAEGDETSSLVGSPLSREELFTRIQAWAEDVDKALHRTDYHSAE